MFVTIFIEEQFLKLVLNILTILNVFKTRFTERNASHLNMT